MKLLGSALAAVLLAAAAGGPCDIKAIEKGLWCRTCGEEVKQTALKSDACAECGKKPAEADFCVKKQYSCCKGVQPKPYKCCGKKPKEEVIRSRVVNKCEGCGKEYDRAGSEVCTLDGCKMEKKKVIRACMNSGTIPHASP